MKRFILAFTMIITAYAAQAESKVEINTWLTAGPVEYKMPLFSDVENVDRDEFKTSDVLSSFQIDLTGTYPKAGNTISLNGQNGTWALKEVKEDSILFSSASERIYLLSAYISIDRWTKGSLNVATNGMFQCYVDDKLIKSKKDDKLKNTGIDLTLDKGKHKIIIKLLSTEDVLKWQANFEANKDFTNSNPQADLNPSRNISINDVLAGTSASSASLSTSGNYAIINYSNKDLESGKSQRYSVIYDVKNRKNLMVQRNKSTRNTQWLPKSDKISYITSFEKKSEIWVYDVTTGVEKSVARNIDKISYLSWSPNEDFIILSASVEAKKPGDLKRLFGPEDNTPGYRTRSYLYKIDVTSGNISQLTYGNQSTNLNDIHPDGSKILFATSRSDYLEVPFVKQNMYELTLSTMELKTIWEDKLYAGNASYSPDGTKLIVSGPPQCFGETGQNVSEGKIPNSFDQQLYIYDISSKKIDPITFNFDPSVKQTYWFKDDYMYLTVEEKEYSNLYKYSFKTKKFDKIDLPVDALSRISFSKNQPIAFFTGSSAIAPGKLYTLDLKKNTSTLFAFPDRENYTNIKFGKVEDWNFENKNGTTIYGRVYYPPQYDASKKYPVIVHYYGGTSPIGRSFGGRYPNNVWAANGYIVYVLQPSGATGFGQEFSALHVNGWGFDAIDDIIDGTKKFLEAHPTADAENVGCIGASYGGYTTMMLQTRTDIFKTGIAHAGISSITSYWGEGYWGNWYSARATTNSYPWNRKDIYVENSPVYNADKFSNSILILHGASDTNVPVGESKQFYLALKLLGKDAEMVLVDGEDHWIIDHKKRIKWHYTIVSWFDKKLKNYPEQWDDMYPEKNID